MTLTDRLLEAYPRLTRDDLHAAMRYAADMLAHEQVVSIEKRFGARPRVWIHEADTVQRERVPGCRVPRERAEHLPIPSDPIQLQNSIESGGLKEAEAARVLHVSQPPVSELLRGRIDLVSTDTRIDMLARLGVGVRLVRGRRWPPRPNRPRAGRPGPAQRTEVAQPTLSGSPHGDPAA